MRLRRFGFVNDIIDFSNPVALYFLRSKRKEIRVQGQNTCALIDVPKKIFCFFPFCLVKDPGVVLTTQRPSAFASRCYAMCKACQILFLELHFVGSLKQSNRTIDFPYF